MGENCTICKKLMGENCQKNDIRIVCTQYSNTPMLMFIEKIIESTFSMNKFNICSNCCGLINELDQIQQRFKAVRQKLTAYLNSAGIAGRNVCQIDELSEIKINGSQSSQQNKMRKNDSSKLHECQFCFKKFAFKSGLCLHIKKNHSAGLNNKMVNNTLPDFHINKKIKIEIDEIINKQESQLISTDQISDENKVYIKNENLFNDILEVKPCTENVKIFNANSSETDGRKSKRKKNPDIPKSHKCSTCEKAFKTLSELKNHMSSHNDVRPFICEICGQGYKNKSALNIHVGMHNGINPFTCILCNKSFTQKGALRRHMPIHTGEAPYQCDLCGKRFVHHTSFHIHQLSHTGQKHYKCSICGLALLSGSHLKRHMRVHTGERNYACPVCGKRFAERYNLASHQKLHDNPGSSKNVKKSYRCQICENSYEKQVKLEEHLVKEHQKIIDTNLPGCQPNNTEQTLTRTSFKTEEISQP